VAVEVAVDERLVLGLGVVDVDVEVDVAIGIAVTVAVRPRVWSDVDRSTVGPEQERAPRQGEQRPHDEILCP
jgi:hypothetical protein